MKLLEILKLYLLYILICKFLKLPLESFKKKILAKPREFLETRTIKGSKKLIDGLLPDEILDDVLIDSPLAGKWIGEIIGNCITSGGIDKASFVQNCFCSRTTIGHI